MEDEEGEDDGDNVGGPNAANGHAAAASPPPVRTNGNGGATPGSSPAPPLGHTGTGASAAGPAAASMGSMQGSFFTTGSGSPMARSTSTRGGLGGPGRGLGRRRRSTTTVAATPAPADARGGATASSLEAALLVHEPPIVVDYFEISAYSQPSLTEGPQQAENLPQRPPANPETEEAHPNCAMAPSSTSVSPRPLSLSASAHAALAKRLGKKPELVEDIIDEALSSKARPLSSGMGAAGEVRRSLEREKTSPRSSAGDQRV